MVNRLKDARESRGVKVYEMGKRIGKRYNQVVQFEQVEYPSIKAIHLYRDALKLTDKEVLNIVTGNALNA